MKEDETYLSALSSGNQKIVVEIYERYFPKVEHFIVSNKGDQHDAKDIFQEALVYIIVKHKEKELKLNSFEAYLFTICKNMWRRHLKKRVIKDEVVTLIDNETDLSLFFLEQKRLEFYQEKFQLLSSNCRDILSNYFNQVNYEELMKMFSYSSLNTVRQRVFKCKAKLTQLIRTDVRYNNYRYERF